MDKQEEWIKKGLKICVNDERISDSEKIEEFLQLEQEYKDFTKEEQRKVIDLINILIERRDRMYVYSYFINYMKIEDFWNEVLDLILQSEFDVRTGIMLEVQVMRNISGHYKEKRILHKKNIEKFIKALDFDYAYIPVENRNRNRIVIMTEQILSDLHAPTREVMNIAYSLQKEMAYEVMFFSCPCNSYLPEEVWYRGRFMVNELPDNTNIKLKYRDTIFRIYQVSLNQDIGDYQVIFDWIYRWNPLFVFAIGAINPVIDLAGKFTTLVARPVSNICPVSEAEILFMPTRIKKVEVEFASIKSENQKQIFMDEKTPIVIEKSQNHYTRLEKGLPNDKFLIAIVGNRLDDEIDMDFILMCKRIVEKISKAAFVIIGKVGERVKSYFSEEIFNNHIFYLGYCHDLVGVYEILDLYINPRRGGGGYSSVMALTAEIPVVSLPQCDVAENVGDEYVVKDYLEMENTIYKYITDPIFYKEMKALARKKIERNTQDKMKQYVEKMVDKIITVIK